MAESVASTSLIWATAGGDNSRRGFWGRPVRVDTKPAKRLPAQGAVQASVVFDARGAAYVADMAGGVQAFAKTGAILWKTTLAGGVSATPVVVPDHGILAVGTHAGWLYALDLERGSTLWRQAMPTKSDPRILSDLLYVPALEAIVLSSWGGRFLALEVRKGTERFTWDAGISPYAAAGADQRGFIFCLRAVAGKGIELVKITDQGAETVLYREPEGQRGARRALVMAPPVLDEARGVIYAIFNLDQGAALRAWSLKDQSPLWNRKLAHSVQAAPTVTKDGIMVADLAGDVHGFSLAGEPRFRYATGAEYLLAGAASESGGMVFIGDPVGCLHAIDATGKGQMVFEASRSFQARPSFSPEDSLFVPGTDRTVYVFAKG